MNKDRQPVRIFVPRSDIGRHLFGVASLAFGVITLVWHNYRDWEQLRPFLNASDGPIFVYAVAIAEIFGGAAMQFRLTARVAAVVLGAVYLVLAVSCVPPIVAAPRVYDPWGNFFEQFSLLTGAVLVYGRFSPAWTPRTLQQAGRLMFGVCAISFAIVQAIHLSDTASLVPKWIPPSPMFWAKATTVAFVLGAVALIINVKARLAARLLTTMLLLFGILVWIPILAAGHHSHFTWSETVETFAITGVAWILADLLGASGLRGRTSY